MTLFRSIGLSFSILIAAFFGLAAPSTAPTILKAGAFTPIGVTQTTLAGAGVTATANTVQLSSFLTPDGRNVVMSMLGSIGYGVLEPQSSKIEDVTFTGITQNSNGTATLTGVTRGNDFVFPYAASTTLAKAHAGGSYFIISNTAGFYGQQFLFSNEISTSSAGIVFSSTTPPYYDEPGAQASGNYISTTSELASVAYVNAVTTAGAPNASISVKGIVQLATARQAASSTLNGSTGAFDVLQSSYATDTPGTLCATTAGGCVLMSLLNGKLSQSWIDFTQLFSFTGGLISTGSSTLVGTSTFVGTTTSVGAAIDYSYEHNYLASTTITTSKAVFISTSTGAVQVSDGSADNSAYFDGFAKTAGTNGNPVLVQESGVVTGLSGLATGTTYYLGSTGALTSSPATAAVPVGVALSASSLLIGKSADNYIMSVTGNNTCNSTTCTVTIAIPADWKKAIVQGSFNGTIELAGQVTLYQFGPTLATITAGLGNSSGNGSISISESVNAITLTSSLSGSENHQLTGTVYLFR